MTHLMQQGAEQLIQLIYWYYLDLATSLNGAIRPNHGIGYCSCREVAIEQGGYYLERDSPAEVAEEEEVVENFQKY